MPCAAPLLLIDELAQRPRIVALLSSEMARAARQQRSVGGRSAVIDLDRGSFLVFMFVPSDDSTRRVLVGRCYEAQR